MATAQLTIGKSIAFLRANFKKALLVPEAGVGIWTSVTISSASRTVAPFTLKSQKSSALMVLLEVLILASRATRAGAVSLGWTA